MSFQTGAQGLSAITSKRGLEFNPLRYFLFIASTHQEPFPTSILQTNLNPIALLERLGILIDKLPFSKGRVTWSHLTRLNFFESYFPPRQRKFLMINSMFLWVLAGARVTTYWYMGRVERRAFMRVVLLARFSQESPQL